ncbi:MAG TPA: hypothetical protein DD638_12275 [Pasteurellaceae bacterium]|nr:hypothetical protein [Pasteurellaceae bacterium]
MPKKYYFQLIQDIILTVILLALTGYHLWSESVHEWLGLVFLALILSHTGLNLWWFKKLLQGEYTAYRLLQTVLNIVLIALFLTAVISGIILSKHIFADFFFHSTTDLARKTHMLSVHWIQIVIALHLGLHWKALANMLSKIFNLNSDSVGTKYFLPAIWMLISVYGFYVFRKRALFPYLIGQVDFAFFNYAESRTVFYLDYFAVLIGFAYLTRFLIWVIFFRQKP